MFIRGRTSEYLLVINTIIFAIAIIGLLAYGFKSSGVNLIFYSIGHLYAYLALIGGTVFLYGVAHFVKEKVWYYYPADSYRERNCFFISSYFVAAPRCMTCLSIHSSLFSGKQAVTNTVQEARGWTADLAWMTFNYGLLSDGRWSSGHAL